MNFYIGLDFGTSGARATVIDDACLIVSEGQVAFPDIADWTMVWPEALNSLLNGIPLLLRQHTRRIAINGTSSTVLLCEEDGGPVVAPLLYNDTRGRSALSEVEAIAPPEHVVRSATSSLTKLLWWQQQRRTQYAHVLLHQADWLGFLLHGQIGMTDYHNALKLGYDVEQLEYPDWLMSLDCSPLLPRVVPPGTPVGTVTSSSCDRFGLPADCVVCAGTTDSIAAFIASGASQPGQAVTSLGSTLVLKLLSQTPVNESQSGVYSHRYGNLWLTGGASNTGGAVLKQFFSAEELIALSGQIDPSQDSGLDYYPLSQPGERFPINEPNLEPCLEPRPSEAQNFLHGLLESMARIERQGYERLVMLGATPVGTVCTAGGGAKNKTWQQIRQRILQVPVLASPQTEAAFGTAMLAKKQGV
ncbi:MAG: FGGY-family carbohydrate kinase [Spirulina sp. SIO3F2]|nr:FGGY-family carbohydrate kinase [Spirulina sp. SIO3F2]